ncbi:hypothetical protein KM92DES2_12679 [uncultured Desulfovibrio sp.]|uniref:Uncharacterized protein n=1 Tax=uncultured Desulfovibrio sp. TaxID=167968 RepID=A0A212KCS8_9BACT|nr:hypothetical protein KM92DES2_12679 [uncultured Desulfovibrio sp.]
MEAIKKFYIKILFHRMIKIQLKF